DHNGRILDFRLAPFLLTAQKIHTRELLLIAAIKIALVQHGRLELRQQNLIHAPDLVRFEAVAFASQLEQGAARVVAASQKQIAVFEHGRPRTHPPPPPPPPPPHDAAVRRADDDRRLAGKPADVASSVEREWIWRRITDRLIAGLPDLRAGLLVVC